MKKLLTVLTLCSGLICGNVSAHGDHDKRGVISEQAAISIANKSLTQMTFKEFGFEVGKLDDSWKSVTSANFTVVSAHDSFYIVSANNTGNDNTIYLKINKNGQVLEVSHKNEF
jgi:hypothetical protein